MPEDALFSDTVSTYEGGASIVIDESASELIPGYRLAIRESLQNAIFSGRMIRDIRTIYEALPDVRFLHENNLPFICIVPGVPRLSEGSPVHATHQWVPVDVVYVCREILDGVTDNARVRRQELIDLGHLIIRIPKMFGSAISTNYVTMPYEKVNSYQQYFSGENQPIVVVSVLSFESLVRDSYTDAC